MQNMSDKNVVRDGKLGYGVEIGVMQLQTFNRLKPPMKS